MTLVAGIDSSTQSVKVIVCDAESGAVVREGRSPHPDGTECAPEAWWDALAAASAGLLEDVEALAVPSARLSRGAGIQPPHDTAVTD